jgi:hypothetical protein
MEFKTKASKCYFKKFYWLNPFLFLYLQPLKWRGSSVGYPPVPNASPTNHSGGVRSGGERQLLP